MDTSYNNIQFILFLLGALLVYGIVRTKREHFVAYNSFETPTITEKDAQNWDTLNDRFGTLLQMINGQTYAMSYQMDNLIQTFSDMLNASGLGKFKVLSIGSSKPFTLLDVVVLDVTTRQPIHFDRVDFITNSLNPFLIQKVITSPSMLNTAPKAIDELRPDSVFRIKNELGLFYPYPTSFNEMATSQDIIDTFQQVLAEKAQEQKTLAQVQPVTLTQTSIN